MVSNRNVEMKQVVSLSTYVGNGHVVLEGQGNAKPSRRLGIAATLD